MTTTTQLFKLEVTYPADAFLPFARCDYCELIRDDDELLHNDDLDEHDWYSELDPSWKPDGWLSDPAARDAWVQRFGDDRFFWPKADKIYFTLGTARKRARLLESYGATVKIIESDPIVWLTDSIVRERRIEYLEGVLSNLRAEAEAEAGAGATD